MPIARAHFANWFAFSGYGASNKCGVGKQAIFEQKTSISLARWRWRLLHYFSDNNVSATCFHVELERSSARGQRQLVFFETQYMAKAIIERLTTLSSMRLADSVSQVKNNNGMTLSADTVTYK